MAQPFSIAHGGKFVANDNGLPVSVVGSLTNQRQIANGLSVGAGATLVVSPGLNMQNFSRGSLVGKADLSHTWTMNFVAGQDGVNYIYTLATSGAVANVAKHLNYTIESDFVTVQIVNGDTVAHTYDLWVRQMQ